METSGVSIPESNMMFLLLFAQYCKLSTVTVTGLVALPLGGPRLEYILLLISWLVSPYRRRESPFK